MEQFYGRVRASGDVITGRQTGWYCVGCEEYKDDPHDAVEPHCPIHQRPLEWRDEENLFFRLSRYQKEIEALVARDEFIAPASRRQEVRNFVQQGLRDFSISRANVSWGLPVPDQPGHTFYVWFDALLGYLSALLDDGESVDLDRLNQAGWPASIHVIGKDILRFHAVYWPAMLMSAGLPLPKRVFGHGFLTREGQKMGKSLGNVLDPEVLLDRCGTDAVRWYLLRDIQFGDDGDFQQKRFVDLVNNDLANTIGNLLNRTSSMARKWFSDAVPPAGSGTGTDHPLAQQAQQTVATVLAEMPELAYKSCSEAILQLAIAANGHLNDTHPESEQPGERLLPMTSMPFSSRRIVGPVGAVTRSRRGSSTSSASNCGGFLGRWLQWGRLTPGDPFQPSPRCNVLNWRTALRSIVPPIRALLADHTAATSAGLLGCRRPLRYLGSHALCLPLSQPQSTPQDGKKTGTSPVRKPVTTSPAARSVP